MEKTLDIRYSAWSDEAAAWLLPACDDVEALGQLQADCAANTATLLTVWNGADMVAAWVVCLVGDTLVVRAAGGYLPGVDLYSTCTFALLKTLPDVRRVRMNTEKLGIIRKVQKMGFVLKTAILEMEVAI